MEVMKKKYKFTLNKVIQFIYVNRYSYNTTRKGANNKSINNDLINIPNNNKIINLKILKKVMIIKIILLLTFHNYYLSKHIIQIFSLNSNNNNEMN